MANILLEMSVKDWVSLGVWGALVSAVGSLLGVVIKEYFSSRSLESWKQRQSSAQLYQKYRDPLMLSACELASRISEVLVHYPTVYLTSAVYQTAPVKQIANDIDDPYFQRYKLVSTAYRLSAFLAWLELYRQELTFLHPGDDKRSRKLEAAAELIRVDLADGQINTASDWSVWRDTLIFREELRSVGDSLIEPRGTGRTVMGYGQYCEHLESSTAGATKRWSAVVLNFLLDLETHEKDFRHVRLKRLLVHLVDFASLMNENSVPSYLQKASNKIRIELA